MNDRNCLIKHAKHIEDIWFKNLFMVKFSTVLQYYFSMALGLTSTSSRDTISIVTDRSADSDQSPEVNIEHADFFSTPQTSDVTSPLIKEPAGLLDSNGPKPSISTSGPSGLKAAQEQNLSPTEPPPPVRRDSQEAAYYVDRTPGQLVVSLLAGVLLSGRTQMERSFAYLEF
jgi:hypothetical protein